MTAPQATDPAAWLDGVQQRNARAWAQIAGLCDGSRRWTMRVPVDSERDSDEVIAAALKDGETATAAVRGVLELADELDGYVHDRGKPQPGSYDHGLSMAQAAVAADLRSAVTAALGEMGGAR